MIYFLQLYDLPIFFKIWNQSWNISTLSSWHIYQAERVSLLRWFGCFMINFLLLGELICLGETFVFFDLNEYKLTIPQKCTDIVTKQAFHELDMKKKTQEQLLYTNSLNQLSSYVIISRRWNENHHQRESTRYGVGHPGRNTIVKVERIAVKIITQLHTAPLTP